MNSRRPLRLFVRLAIQDMGHRPFRAVLLSVAVAVAGASMFAAMVLRQAIEQSAGTSLDRLGADLMAVPRATIVNLTVALLTVEPTDQTLDSATVAALSALPGVDLASPQRHLALPSSDGAHGGTEDLIAFDPGRDFTVRPWLVESAGSPFARGDLIVGGRRPEPVGGIVRIFNRDLRVHGRLALTGVGPFERAYFTSFETAADIARAAEAVSGKPFADALDTDRASALLVRLKVGATPEQFRFAAARHPDVQVVAGNGLSTSVRQALRLVLGGSVVFSALILVATALMVAAMYTGLLNERRHELGTLLALGMRPAQLVRLILAEAAITTGLGGIFGALVGALVLVAFERSLGFLLESNRVPFALPGMPALVSSGVLSASLCGLVGLLGAWLPAWRAGRSEPYSLMRGEAAG